MKAIGLIRYLPIENPESLVDVEVSKPIPTGHDILVSIKAISINPVDVKVRAPKDTVEKTPRILGWDASGIVEAIGDEVTLFKVGDEVYYAGDITRSGAYAEYQLVDERIVGCKPTSLSFAQAAALPLTTITAYEALFERLHIARDDSDNSNSRKTLLIIGGAGGVGSIGIQLAKTANLKVIATASRPETIAWVKDLGADHVINHHKTLRQQIDSIGLDFVDYIAIFNDTDGHWNTATDLVCPQGSIVSIVENNKPLNQETMKTKSATFAWEFMFTRSMFQTPDLIEQHKLLKWVAHEIDAGRIRTTLNKVFTPINAVNIRKAHTLIETGQAKGKVVLEKW
ncbi:MAG: zinc-binding alcohol dehydrogenase family protein [Nitrososphaeraceae archaeon]